MLILRVLHQEKQVLVLLPSLKMDLSLSHSRKPLMLAYRPSSRRALPTSLPSKINCWRPSTSNRRPSRPGMPPS